MTQHESRAVLPLDARLHRPREPDDGVVRSLTRRTLLGLALLHPLSAHAEEIAGRVAVIIDGDTIDVLTARSHTLRIRLSGIDAPEIGQAFGRNAKATLYGLAFDRTAFVEWHKRDRYNRLVGKVAVHGRDIAREMLALGMAWHYRRFESEQSAADRERYREAEGLARSARRGLWADPAPQPPWSYRAERRGHKVSPT